MGEIKLGSLFDGSGGFPLAGTFFGIVPVWASEIEPYPIRVTTARFPHMEHLGDITKIDGGSIEPVDIITFGSPCQDLSIAGKKAGIYDGQRSNLFFEAVRIIKEMRRATDGKYPRFAVWENVPGAFSSNKGRDFKAVLEALSAIKDPNVGIPEPPNGKWQHAGAIVGDGYSIAWRVYDAQFWGVPQRRKRIYLITDFRNERAGEILFEPESVRGHFETCQPQGQGTPDNVKGSVAGSYRAVGIDGYNTQVTGDKTITIRAGKSDQDHVGCVCIPNGRSSDCELICVATQQGGAEISDNGLCPTITASAGMSGNNQPYIACHNEHNAVLVCKERADKPGGGKGILSGENVAFTLATHTDEHICYPINTITPLFIEPRQCYTRQSHTAFAKGDTASTLKQRDYKDFTDVIEDRKPNRKYILRRLTPLECCRLQGFPDWWTDGVDGSDSAKYKMWGNGIALPCAVDVIGRLYDELTNNKNAETH